MISVFRYPFVRLRLHPKTFHRESDVIGVYGPRHRERRLTAESVLLGISHHVEL